MSGRIPEHNPNSFDTIFGRLEGKLDGIASDITEIKNNNKDLAKRVTVLESFRYYVLSTVAVVSSAITYFIDKKFLK